MLLATRSLGPGRHQPRLVTPIADRMRGGPRGGDVLVSLGRGLAGKRGRHVRIAHRLGLRRWGDQRMVDRNDLVHMGMALEIRHLVTITFLSRTLGVEEVAVAPVGLVAGPLTGTKYGTRLERLIPSVEPNRLWVGSMRTIDLTPGLGVTGGYFEFENEEYIQVEATKTGATVMWSSELDASGFVGSATSKFGVATPECHGYLVTADGDDVSAATEEILELAKEASEPVAVALGFVDSVISWREPTVKLRKGNVPHVELALSFENIPLDEVVAVMGSTASPAVRANLDANRGRLAAELKAHVI